MCTCERPLSSNKCSKGWIRQECTRLEPSRVLNGRMRRSGYKEEKERIN